MVGFVKVKWISLFLMIIYIKYIKLIFMSFVYLFLKWVEFKKIFVYVLLRIKMLVIK